MFKNWGELTFAIAYERDTQIAGVIQWDEWHNMGKLPSVILLPALMECVQKANALNIEDYLNVGKCEDMIQAVFKNAEKQYGEKNE